MYINESSSIYNNTFSYISEKKEESFNVSPSNINYFISNLFSYVFLGYITKNEYSLWKYEYSY